MEACNVAVICACSVLVQQALTQPYGGTTPTCSTSHIQVTLRLNRRTYLLNSNNGLSVTFLTIAIRSTQPEMHIGPYVNLFRTALRLAVECLPRGPWQWAYR
jgi:hypothetical protein